MIRYHKPALGPAGGPQRHGRGDAHRPADHAAPLALPATGVVPDTNPRARLRWQLTPDSIMSRLVAAVLEATRTCGHALERHQVHEAYTARHKSPVIARRILDTSLRTLVGQGRIVRTVGRPGSYGYHHPDHRVPEAPLAQEVERLLATVERLYVELGRPVSTHELGRDMRQEAGVAHDYALFDHLLTQLTLARTVGAPRWRKPALDLVTPTTTFGVQARFWAPAGREQLRRERGRASSGEPPVVEARSPNDGEADRGPGGDESARVPRLGAGARSATAADGGLEVSAGHGSRAEALRQSIGLAEDVLRRPVSRSELSWWCRAHADNPAAAATSWGKGRRPFRDTARRDAFFPCRVGRMRTVANDMTCGGGAPIRYGLWRGTDPLVGDLSTVLEDLCRTLSPAAELDGLVELENWHRHSRSTVVATMAQVRRDVLQRVVVERLACWIDSGADGTDRTPMLAAPTARAAIESALRAVANAIAVMRQRVGSVRAAPEERTRARQALDEQARDIDALRPLVARWWLAHLGRRTDIESATRAVHQAPGTIGAAHTHGAPQRPTVIGEVSLVPIAWMRPFCDFLARAGGHDAVKYRYNLTKRMRRFRVLTDPRVAPTSSKRPRPIYRRAQAQPGYLDRVDALSRAFRIDGVPRARALVDGAARLMGFVIRDARLLAELRHDCGDAGERRLLLIALGLLGDLNGVIAAGESLVRDHDSGERAIDASDARAIVLALACAAPPDAPHILAAIERDWPVHTRATLATATMRLHAGCVQGVIE